MTKSKFMRIVLVAGSALILIGVALMVWMLVTEDERNEIEVHLADGKTESIKFENLSLVPGESCEYVISLKGDRVSQYDLTLDFVETEEKTLKNYARVKILADDTEIYDELLATAFEKAEIVLPVDFGENKNTSLKVVYYLPLDVGNEAKNAEAVFELLLTASNEKE